RRSRAIKASIIPLSYTRNRIVSVASAEGLQNLVIASVYSHDKQHASGRAVRGSDKIRPEDSCAVKKVTCNKQFCSRVVPVPKGSERMQHLEVAAVRLNLKKCATTSSRSGH